MDKFFVYFLCCPLREFYKLRVCTVYIDWEQGGGEGLFSYERKMSKKKHFWYQNNLFTAPDPQVPVLGVREGGRGQDVPHQGK